jgi:Protein of unknown function (DUF4233)
MKVMARSVLVMEAITVGFALLLVRLDAKGFEVALGGVIAIALILNSGLLRFKWGWWLGGFLQVAVILYGFVITSMFFMGAIFAALWIGAIAIGRKGERIQAALKADYQARTEAKGESKPE